ncbi:MAG TPA: hypothetical protein PLW37_09470 [bacterium]|nr:hypothetical protein [bacterium]
MKERVFFLFSAVFLLISCSEAKLEKIFEDNFERAELGENYTVQGGDWKIDAGAITSSKAENRNLVLTGAALPQNGVIELTMWSESEGVDVKFNAWGDGKIHDHGDGYSFILGGWQNRVSVISKLHEHEKKRSEERDIRLKKGERYRVKIVRKASDIKWFVNDRHFMSYNDDDPLKTSDGFDRFSFGNWRSKVFFDDLKIYKFAGE